MSRRINIQETVEATIPNKEIARLQESASSSKELPDKITTIVEGIHSGLTRNYTFYPADNLEKSVESWTKPYEKPVIKNHDVHEEPLGRVKRASFKQSNIAPDKHTIELELEITDKETIQKVLDGRYHTLSIGGSAGSVTCSACGKDLVKEGYCGHMKGRTYEGKQAHWIIGEMNFDEISWVNVPADSNAQVVHKNTAAKQTESVSTEKGGESMPEDLQANDILEQIDNLVGNVQESESTEGETPNPEAQTEGDTSTEGETPEAGGSEAPEAQAEGTEKPEGEATLQEQLDAANEKIKTLEAENTTLVADKETLQEEVNVLTAEKTTLTERVATLEAELAVADQENSALVKQNVTLATYTHKTLVESVAGLQVVLGKVEESALEEATAELAKQTTRSLKEQLVTLSAERPQRVIQTVEHPQATGGSEDITESTKQEPKKLDLQAYAEKISEAMNRQFNNN